MKRQFKSYVECEAAYRRESENATINAIAVNAMLTGEHIEKMRRGAYTARVIRPTSACGGLVLITYRCEGQADSTCAYYVDQFCDVRHSPCSPTDQEGRDYRELAYDVIKYRNDAVHAANPQTWAKPSPDVSLSSGRIVRHVRQVNGSQLATPTTGPDEMTDAEWEEYANVIRDRSRKVA